MKIRIWLPASGDVRTNIGIVIPFNPLIFYRKSNSKLPPSKPAVNVILKAEEYLRLLHNGVVKSRIELAQREGVSRARVSQILNLLKLAPEIKEYLKDIHDESVLRFFTERRLRRIAPLQNWETQRREFMKLRRSQGEQEVL